MIPRGAAGVRLVRTGHVALLHSRSLFLNKGLPRAKKGFQVAGEAKQSSFCLFCLLSDKDDYKELLGAVDNAFLVAYAIGMFIR